jgi:predicted small secreted protein
MKKPNAKLILLVLASAALMAACGGRSGDGVAVDAGGGGLTGNNPPGDISASVSALMAYMERMMGMDGNTDLVDINTITLVTDNSVEPSPSSF